MGRETTRRERGASFYMAFTVVLSRVVCFNSFFTGFFFFLKLVEEKKSDGLLIKEYKLLHDKEESTVVTWGLTILYKIR